MISDGTTYLDPQRLEVRLEWVAQWAMKGNNSFRTALSQFHDFQLFHDSRHYGKHIAALRTLRF